VVGAVVVAIVVVVVVVDSGTVTCGAGPSKNGNELVPVAAAATPPNDKSPIVEIVTIWRRLRDMRYS